MALCIKGLRSGNHEIIKISLTRIRNFIFTDFLASRFDQDDGVVMLVSLLGHQDVLASAGGDDDDKIWCTTVIWINSTKYIKIYQAVFYLECYILKKY